jgi:hypothetical protein
MRDAQARLRLDALLVLIALVVAVVLCVVGWFLARELHSNQKVEDCVLSAAPIACRSTRTHHPTESGPLFCSLRTWQQMGAIIPASSQ